MASNASLYGSRKPKTTTKEVSSSTSLAFSSTLNSLLSSATTSSQPTSGRPRPSKHSKDDIFTSHNKNTKKRAARDLEDDSDDGARRWGASSKRQDIGGVDEASLHRSRRKLEAKSKLYKEMKRGEYIAREGEDNEALVDFDRKWAEGGERSAAGEDSDSDDDWADRGRGGEMVEYEDEYGRLRRGTKADVERMERKKQNRALGQEELDRMSARPAMPEKLIYGDTVQSLAFNPDKPVVEKMEEIARKRDRSLTPPEQKHYEADREFRIKGMGFYNFSKDEGMRKKEMEALEQERLETERVRREREEKKDARRREIDERKRAIGEKRAKKQAESFLDGLKADLDKPDVT